MKIVGFLLILAGFILSGSSLIPLINNFKGDAFILTNHHIFVIIVVFMANLFGISLSIMGTLITIFSKKISFLQKRCFVCNEQINKKAKKCTYCHEWVEGAK